MASTSMYRPLQAQAPATAPATSGQCKAVHAPAGWLYSLFALGRAGVLASGAFGGATNMRTANMRCPPYPRVLGRLG